MLANYMAQLSKELEMEAPLQQQVPGVFSFPLEANTIQITEMQPQGLQFNCTIGPCPQTNQEMFFTQLLFANLFGQGTRGAVLGLDEEGQNLIISRTVPHQVEYQAFRDLLEDFANMVEYWGDEAKAQK